MTKFISISLSCFNNKLYEKYTLSQIPLSVDKYLGYS